MIKHFTLKLTTRALAVKKIDELLSSNPGQDYTLTVVEKSPDRGLSSNGQIHLWFGQIAKKQGYNSDYIKNSCKVMFGIDILLGSEKEAAKSVIRTLERVGYWDMDWSTKVDVVSGLMVTSLFKVKEMKVFMEHMIYFWNDKDIPIKFKD